MSGFTPKIPLTPSATDGFYALTKNLRENVKQSLKMIVLTSPGERMMNPLFGVGARQFLFEQFTDDLFKTFRSKVIEQTKRYLPLVEIIEISFFDTNRDPVINSTAEANVLAVEIKYAITNLNIFDSLFIEDIPTGT
mgnify:CR=1 FL=1|tara:strand:- start:304 stop:714 length:411 start_codon:yes stop_codon:yes gene_type:complete